MTYQVIIFGGPEAEADGRMLFASDDLSACQTLARALDRAWDQAADENGVLARHYKANNGGLGAFVIDDSGAIVEY